MVQNRKDKTSFGMLGHLESVAAIQIQMRRRSAGLSEEVDADIGLISGRKGRL